MNIMTFKEFLLENEFLTEEYDYKQMFGKYLELYPDIETTDDKIEWAKSNLKKNVRIIWYLQWYALDRLYRNSTSSKTENVIELIKLYSKKLQEMSLKCKTSITEIKDIVEGMDIHGVGRYLVHFYKLGIKEIDEFNPTGYTPTEVFDILDKIEANWSDDVSGTVKYLSQPLSDDVPESLYAIEIVMDLGNDWYWLDLNTHCNALESEAMDHCGNVDSDSTLLSCRHLNKRRPEKESWLWEPHLTFELDSDHNLRMMKGKSNSKPKAIYHPYIISLLKFKSTISSNSDTGYYINGIVGGGYKPETNFSIEDLSTEQYVDLIRLRPDLMPLRSLYNSEGLTATVIERIVRESGFQYLPSEKCFNIGKHKKGVYDFIRENGNDTAKGIADVMEGNTNIDNYNSEGDNVLQELDRDKVLAYLQENFPDDEEEWEDDTSDYIKNNVDEIWDECVQAVSRGCDDGIMNEMSESLKYALTGIQVQVDGDNTGAIAYINPMFESDDSCLIKIRPDYVVDFITDYADKISDGDYTFSIKCTEPHYGFSGYDQSAAMEYAKNETEVIWNLLK